MTGYRKRASLRNYDEGPVMYADCDTVCYHDGKFYNRSLYGMYFESSYLPKPESDIIIMPDPSRLEIPRPFYHKAFRARVIWFREVPAMIDLPCFGVGVQYMANSHLNLLEAAYTCDLCGVKTSYNKINKGEEDTICCEECTRQFRDLPGGTIRECLSDFLLGNVI